MGSITDMNTVREARNTKAEDSLNKSLLETNLVGSTLTTTENFAYVLDNLCGYLAIGVVKHFDTTYFFEDASRLHVYTDAGNTQRMIATVKPASGKGIRRFLVIRAEDGKILLKPYKKVNLQV